MALSSLVTHNQLTVPHERCRHSSLITRSSTRVATCRRQKSLLAAAGRYAACRPCSNRADRQQAPNIIACRSSPREAGNESQRQLLTHGVPAASMAQAAWPGWAGAKDAGQQTLETLGGGIETLQQAPKGGLTPLGLIAVFSPVLLYGVFSIIRTTLNPRLKLSDFYFIAAGGVITINIISIVFFKVRFF